MKKMKRIKCFFYGHDYVYEEINLGIDILNLFSPTKTLYARCNYCKNWDTNNVKIEVNEKFKSFYQKQI